MARNALRSMTGFGAAAGETGSRAMRLEIRSVNHRHLLVKSRLGADFAHLETDVERRVRGKLDRGSVSLHLAVSELAGDSDVTLDAGALERWRDELEAVAKRLQLSDRPSLDMLLAMPGVVNGTEEDVDPEELAKSILALVEEGLERLVEMREVEGEKLLADLRKNAQAVQAILVQIHERVPQVVRDHRDQLVRRIQELVDQQVSETDLAREIAILADRLDVSEEISRLESHMHQLEDLLGRGGTIGRKLDFLVQEVFREVNTIGAKCSDARIAHWIVDAKTHVERLREQVQNVE